MTEWPENYEDFKASLRETKIPADKELLFREKIEAHMKACAFNFEERHTLWDIFDSCILSPSTPPPALPLSL